MYDFDNPFYVHLPFKNTPAAFKQLNRYINDVKE